MRFVLAGRQSQLLGRVAYSGTDVKEILADWKPRDVTADISSALALAENIAGGEGRIVVLTDTPPVQDYTSKRVRYIAVGKAMDNVGFVTSSRGAGEQGQRILLEISNFSPSEARRTLTIVNGRNSQRQPLVIEPGKTRRLIVPIAESTGTVMAKLTGDDLVIDDTVHIVPEPTKKVRVSLALQDITLAEHFRRAINATVLGEISDRRPELIIHDSTSPPDNNRECWSLAVVSSQQKAQSYAGPYIVDYSHPLTSGLDMAGVIWAADDGCRLTATPVIATGDVVLLSDKPQFDGRHELTMQLIPRLSTLTRSTVFPVLIQNLLAWRSMASSGIDAGNIRLGWRATIHPRISVESVEVTSPDLKKSNLSVIDDTVVIPGRLPGVYSVRVSKSEQYSFACNALSRSESDLTGLGSGSWGQWDELGSFGEEYYTIFWLPALVALLALVAHTVLMQHSMKVGNE